MKADKKTGTNKKAYTLVFTPEGNKRIRICAIINGLSVSTYLEKVGTGQMLAPIVLTVSAGLRILLRCDKPGSADGFAKSLTDSGAFIKHLEYSPTEDRLLLIASADSKDQLLKWVYSAVPSDFVIELCVK